MNNINQLQSMNQYFAGASRFRIHIYLDAAAFTQYVCDNNTWANFADTTRRVTKCVYDSATYDNLVDVMAWSPIWQGLYGEYACPATNLATVQGLDYA